MFIRIWRFITLILASLSMALSFCHLMELPARITWDASLWVNTTVFGGLYRMFGMAGAFIDPGAILAAAVLSFLVRRRRPSFYYTVAGTACLALALALWFGFVAPANAELATWLSQPIPPGWQQVRNQWEYTHAVNAFIKLLGFGALVFSVLVETPVGRRPSTVM